MKTFFVAVLIGVLLVAGGFVYDLCIKDFSAEMLKSCESMEDKINSIGAQDTAREIEEYLSGKKTLLASIINHDSIDEIETCITELMSYIDSENYKEATVRCRKLKLLVERLPMQYRLSLQNIL